MSIDRWEAAGTGPAAFSCRLFRRKGRVWMNGYAPIFLKNAFLTPARLRRVKPKGATIAAPVGRSRGNDKGAPARAAGGGAGEKRGGAAAARARRAHRPGEGEARPQARGKEHRRHR